jgi:hypothetical protein
MAEIRVQVADAVLEDVKKTLSNVRTNTQLIEEALTLLKWAADEAAQGRLILSSNAQGGDVTRLAMPSLMNASAPLK